MMPANRPTVAQLPDVIANARQLLKSGQTQAAVDQLVDYTQAQTDAYEAYQLLCDIFTRRRQWSDALVFAQRASQCAPADERIKSQLRYAELCCAAHRPNKAIELLQLILREQPNTPVALSRLGILLCEAGKMDGAAHILEKALHLQPNDAPTLIAYATLQFRRGDTDSALSTSKHALEKAPENARIRYNYAVMLELLNRLEEAREQSDILHNLAPDDPTTILFHAKLLRRSKQYQAALDYLTSTCTHFKTAQEQKRIAFELGWLHDKLGNTERAMHCLEQGNQQALSQYARDVPLAAYNRELDEVFSHLTNETAESLNRLKSHSPSSPIFVMGFPRSGTTLTHHILGSHSALEVLEEKPVLHQTFVDFCRREAPVCAYLQASDTTRQHYRQNYETRLADLHLQRETQLVDKLPLNFTKLPFVKYLYPNARIIFVLRHPCDALLSCLNQNFVLNSAMAHFTSLESSVALYARCMEFWLSAKDMLKLNCHILHYEAMVADQETTSRNLFAFLGLPWETQALEFDTHARNQGLITTPSYEQVSQPIYSTSVGRWKPYSAYFSPYRDTLNPLIEALGYRELIPPA